MIQDSRKRCKFQYVSPADWTVAHRNPIHNTVLWKSAWMGAGKIRSFVISWKDLLRFLDLLSFSLRVHTWQDTLRKYSDWKLVIYYIDYTGSCLLTTHSPGNIHVDKKDFKDIKSITNFVYTLFPISF